MCLCIDGYIKLGMSFRDMPRYIHSFIYTCNSCISVHMAVRRIYLISRTCFNIPDVFPSYFLTITNFKKITIAILFGQVDWSLTPNLTERKNAKHFLFHLLLFSHCCHVRLFSSMRQTCWHNSRS